MNLYKGSEGRNVSSKFNSPDSLSVLDKRYSVGYGLVILEDAVSFHLERLEQIVQGIHALSFRSSIYWINNSNIQNTMTEALLSRCLSSGRFEMIDSRKLSTENSRMIILRSSWVITDSNRVASFAFSVGAPCFLLDEKGEKFPFNEEEKRGLVRVVGVRDLVRVSEIAGMLRRYEVSGK